MTPRFACLLVFCGLAALAQTTTPVPVRPNLIVSYLVSGGNQTPLSDGDTLAFGNVAVGQSGAATVFINNRGSGPGALTKVTADGGEAFRVSGLPLLPADIAPEREIRFTVTFTPTSLSRSIGYIRIETSTGSRLIVLEGQGIGPNLTWQWRATPVVAGASLTFPDTTLGGNSTAILMIRNEGTAEARISSASVSGTGFAFVEPPPLPLQLAPGASTQVAVLLSPRDVGNVAGRLRIDNVQFELNGMVLGPKLSLTAVSEAGATLLQATSAVLFANTKLGSSTAVEIRVENTGNSEAAITSISVAGSAFVPAALPQLPAVIPPGQVRSFQVRFSPDGIGALSGTLQVDDQRFTLRGTGTQPDLIEGASFRITGSSGEPLDQPAVALSLDRPYSIPLTGRLTLSFASEVFSDDPNIQFATGGRTVEFRIPANATDAIFGTAARQVLLQVGTVAGQITLTPTFNYGAVNLTPEPAPTRQISIGRNVPSLRKIEAISRSANTLELMITGYSTTRDLDRFSLQLTPIAGRQLQTTRLVAETQSAFAAWYQSTAARPFGGQFSATLTLNTTSDFSAVQSITITGTNTAGESVPISVKLQ